MKNILVIDGQGGRIGKQVTEMIKREFPELPVTAVGTNSTATASMLKGGADQGATGENPVIVACRQADIIIGPIGIVMADALLGEITPAMATAVASSSAIKLLIPVNRCNHIVVGLKECSTSDLLEELVLQIRRVVQE